MSLYLYSEQRSFFHELHPVSKIIGLLLSFVAALAFSHPLYILPLAILVIIPGLRAGAGEGLRRVWPLMIAIGLASFLLWGLFFPGKTVVYSPGPFRITREALLYGAGMAVRLNLMLFCGLIFLASTRIEDFTAGLSIMGIPFSLSFALSLSFRLVPIFSETAQTIIQAQRCRGLEVESKGPIKRLFAYLPLLVPIFASALRRTDQLAVALESKGFGSKAERTTYREYLFRVQDVIFLVMMTVVSAGSVVIRLFGQGAV
jgi:energy-coupling factor transport system permease protein